MRQTWIRIHALMIAVVLTAVVTRVVLQWLDIHLHDFHLTFRSPR